MQPQSQPAADTTTTNAAHEATAQPPNFLGNRDKSPPEAQQSLSPTEDVFIRELRAGMYSPVALSLWHSAHDFQRTIESRALFRRLAEALDDVTNDWHDNRTYGAPTYPGEDTTEPDQPQPPDEPDPPAAAPAPSNLETES